MMYTRLPLNARANPNSPRAYAVCDRCGFVYNHQDLNWQGEWIGPRIQNLKILVCKSCLDKHQEQLRTFIIPPDPIPIYTPRPEQYDAEVLSLLSAEDQDEFTTEDGVFNLITEIEDTLSPDPNNPVI